MSQEEIDPQRPEENEASYAQPPVDPNQAYVDPNQVYVDPNQAYVDPNQAYVDPNQQYVDPNQAYQGTPDVAPLPPTPPPGETPDVPVSAAPVTPAAAPATVGGGRPPRNPQTRTPAGRSSYRRKAKVSRGISGMDVFLGLCALLVGGVMMMAMSPKELRGIKGYPSRFTSGEFSGNVLETAQGLVTYQGSTEATFSELELNNYLNARLKGDQAGLLGSLIQYKGTYVDLEPGSAEVVVERSLFGRPFTMSATFDVVNVNGRSSFAIGGWSFGKIETRNRTIGPVQGLFKRLQGALSEEYLVLKDVNEVRIEKDRVILRAKSQS